MFSRRIQYILFPAALSLLLSSCQTIDLYEKNVAIPGHEWSAVYKPEFAFTITDTSSLYHIYIVLRHNEKYNWNNIWLQLTTRVPGDTSYRREKYELTLANNEGWVGSAMDDVYETRVRITPREGIPLRKGEYRFSIAHIMREEPLRNVMNVGLRVEKKEQ